MGLIYDVVLAKDGVYSICSSGEHIGFEILFYNPRSVALPLISHRVKDGRTLVVWEEVEL